MALKFGTSGVRGLVTDMTDLACYRYAAAFGQLLLENTEAREVCIAGDHRSSTPRIMNAVSRALLDLGLAVVNTGPIPTPAVAHYAMGRGAGSIMVTGSHIPDDRNGIKFYMPWGEILKKEEQEISAREAALKEEQILSGFDGEGQLASPASIGEVEHEAREAFVERYRSVLPSDTLEGIKLVVYQHSSVLRDIYPELFEALGAEVVKVGWSDAFVPVDTEAVNEPERLKAWTLEHEADALISADGDGDRPLLVDERGEVLRGDLLCLLAARFLGASDVAAPVSCNTALEKSGAFGSVQRTRIGSPFVIEAMNEMVSRGAASVIGYEANGGFLTATEMSIGQGRLTALPTRDAILPILAVLMAAKGSSISNLLSELPSRVTGSVLVRDGDMDRGRAWLNHGQGGLEGFQPHIPETLGAPMELDLTDGCRVTLEGGDIVHFRPSGNAPEFRCYVESDSEEECAALASKAEAFLRNLMF